jgi:hypothetical protein
LTDIRKSDAQLDAEAAQPLEERDLDAAIALHRAAFAADRNWLLKLHVRDGDYGLGVPFSPAFEALLEGRLGQFPYSKALLHLRERYCRATHPSHTSRPEWRGSLCSALVSIVIRLEQPIAEAQRQLGLPNEGKTRRTLDNALLYVERRVDEFYEAQRRPVPERTPAEWMGPAHVHQTLGGLHREECPQCQRAA